MLFEAGGDENGRYVGLPQQSEHSMIEFELLRDPGALMLSPNGPHEDAPGSYVRHR